MNRRPRALAKVVFLFLLLFTNSQTSIADCSCGGGDLEIVFILDCSGSMNHTLGTLQEQIKRVMEALGGQIRHMRTAVVVYRTLEYNGKQKKLDFLPFTSDGKAVADYLRTQTAEGGGEEIIDLGLKAAIEDLKWTKGARKVAVLMGDEQGNEKMQARSILLAREMKEKGIVLNTVTASQTAWIYWAPANTTSWKQQLAGMGEEVKRTFKLPYYVDLADAGGGIGVSSWSSKELVLWLLAFSLGLNDKEAKDKIDVDKFMEWAKQREQEEIEAEKASMFGDRGAKETPLLGTLKHGGEWQVPHPAADLLTHIGGKISLAGPAKTQTISLTDEQLERFPILYVSGHGPIKWTKAERDALKSRLERGGFLFADACCGDVEFSKSLREILAELFPGRSLEKLPPSHTLFSCGHRIEKVRRSEATRTGKFDSVDAELWGLSIPSTGAVSDGKPRLAVVFSPHDLGCAWHARPLGVPCQHQDEDGLQLSANVILWALTR